MKGVNNVLKTLKGKIMTGVILALVGVNLGISFFVYDIFYKQLKTNIKNVFAIGDIRENSTKQIVCACSDGAIAALNALKAIKK